VRESASLAIAADLLDAGAESPPMIPIATEPFIARLRTRGGPDRLHRGLAGRGRGAEIVVIATKWDEYGELAGQAQAGQIVFDARRMLDPDTVKARYLTIGRRIEAAAC
jgi:UDP-glucose 6-dehydrogenase